MYWKLLRAETILEIRYVISINPNEFELIFFNNIDTTILAQKPLTIIREVLKQDGQSDQTNLPRSWLLLQAQEGNPFSIPSSTSSGFGVTSAIRKIARKWKISEPRNQML